MRILVTGANGFLGRGVVKKLLDMGYEVAAADRNVNKVDERASLYPCDIFDVQDSWSYFNKPDVLLHMAWRNGFQHESDTHIEELPKHYMFLKKAAESNFQTIAVMSSMHEVGQWEGMITESTQCNPVTPYGISKNALKGLTKMLCTQYNKVFLWLRGFYVVSEDYDGSSIFSKIMQAENEGRKTFPFTTGEASFDFLEYEKYCQYIAKAVVQNQVTGIIEICSGYPERISDCVERFIHENNLHICLEYGAFPSRVYDNRIVWGDRQKIDKILKNAQKGEMDNGL